MSDQSQYLNKSVKVVCSDNRVLYGVLSSISSPFSIILQHSVATHPSPLELDIEFDYNPQYLAKYFTNDESLREAYNNYNKATEETKQELQQKVDEAKAFNDLFMKDKYYVGSVAIPGEHIQNIILIQ
ncbi:unnamed protein product (macronuclear) [Paramecium tetraurelia]|uniref:Lsm14-like N-terminal domain-containing protein n=1 Tax=Paramecium tetraurelia TaxID=5888 RepID=A0DL62_PARTE|nr:uncharacterized protein GSPATT00018096001 [Paramecium tetraurelia]CAK83779.1 unnamed protein product [Paramecium tetraurelia]|eukprot:XP_001451176.1 hypothetical protein (macronuclear) [Paramecium tetraurelia strain d4-2]